MYAFIMTFDNVHFLSRPRCLAVNGRRLLADVALVPLAQTVMWLRSAERSARRQRDVISRETSLPSPHVVIWSEQKRKARPS